MNKKAYTLYFSLALLASINWAHAKRPLIIPMAYSTPALSDFLGELIAATGRGDIVAVLECAPEGMDEYQDKYKKEWAIASIEVEWLKGHPHERGTIYEIKVKTIQQSGSVLYEDEDILFIRQYSGGSYRLINFPFSLSGLPRWSRSFENSFKW